MKANRFLRPEMNPHTFLSENGKLYFSEVQEADAADYHCIVTLVALPGQQLATAQPLTRNSLGIRLQVAGESRSYFFLEIVYLTFFQHTGHLLTGLLLISIERSGLLF